MFETAPIREKKSEPFQYVKTLASYGLYTLITYNGSKIMLGIWFACVLQVHMLCRNTNDHFICSWFSVPFSRYNAQLLSATSFASAIFGLDDINKITRYLHVQIQRENKKRSVQVYFKILFGGAVSLLYSLGSVRILFLGVLSIWELRNNHQF